TSMWWTSVSHTCAVSGSSPQAVAVLSTADVPVGTRKSLLSVWLAPTSSEAMMPMSPSLSSLAVTLVRATSPMLVTLNVYVTVWPSCAVAGPDFTTVMAGCSGVRWWWSSSQTLSESGSNPQAVTVLSTPEEGEGTVKSSVRV